MRCVIVCASPKSNTQFIKSQIKPDDFIICADNGLTIVNEIGIKPDLIVGDFDSYFNSLPSDVETITLNPHKNDTDTEFAVEQAIKRGYNEILLLGATGGRIDHTIANIALLQLIVNKSLKAVIKSELETIEVLNPGKYTYNDQKGKTFSLFPFGCEGVVVTYDGVEYPLNKHFVKSYSTLGVSNIFTHSIVTVTIHSGNALFIINEQV